VTTNDGYLEPMRRRPQLHVLGGALVDRVAFDGTTAVGVRALTSGGALEVRAATVVLCAGAAATPAILQRSGVGPSALLRALGISIVADLPVGEGMQDHVGFWLSVELEGGRPARTGARGNCTLRYTSGIPGSGAGDLLMISANPAAESEQEGAVGVKLARCFSRGVLAIRSSDPSVPPRLDLDLYGDERDRVLARRALRDALDLLQAVRGVRMIRDRFGDEVPAAPNDAAIDAWLPARSYDTSHLSCGAAVGRVADSAGRVQGVDGLWVADLSLVPTVPRANTHLTAVMIGERAADQLSPQDR
jgi:choline dehydrogenase